MSQATPATLFKTDWISFELPGYRPCAGTYDHYPYDSIPPLPQEQFTGQLQWLAPLDSEINQRMQRYRLSPERRAKQIHRWTDDLKNIIASAQHFGLTLPEAFLRLLTSPELQDRIPSCTACHFELFQLASCPGNKEDGYVIRFLHDQQDCVMWHLYLSSAGDECVLASNTYLDLVSTDPEEVGNLTEEESVAQTWICAPSFEAFLYRFWIENVIWYNLSGRKPLTEEQKRYLAFYEAEK